MAVRSEVFGWLVVVAVAISFPLKLYIRSDLVRLG